MNKRKMLWSIPVLSNGQKKFYEAVMECRDELNLIFRKYGVVY